MTKRKRWLLWGFIALLVLFSLFSGYRKKKHLRGWGKDKIALLTLQGIIVTGKSSSGGFLSSATTGSETVVNMLEEIGKRKDIRGVLLRMNTPGGTVAGAQEIYEAVEKLKKKGKKVVVSIADLCASGGYYIASASDYIFANPGSLTGSIGAIFMFQNLQELYKKIGIDVSVIKSGPYKDIGSPLRKMTKQEEKILQGIILDVYNQFVTDLARGRKMEIKKIKKMADGRIYTGNQAYKLKLVDALGNLSSALRYLGQVTGLGEKPFVESFEVKHTPWELLFSKFAPTLPYLSFPLVMYLYAPGS